MIVIAGRFRLILLVILFLSTEGFAETQWNVRNFGAAGNGISRPASAAELIARGSRFVESYEPGDEWDSIGILEAIRAAKPGDTVFLPAGTYNLYRVGGTLQLRAGVRLLGQSAVLRVPQGKSAAYDLLEVEAKPLSNIQIEGIRFEGVSLRVSSLGARFSSGHLTFRDCGFHNGGPSQILLGYVSDVEFRNCKFTRDAAHVGRSIVIYVSRRIRISNSEWQGHFVTAINASGVTPGAAPSDMARTTEIEITNNKIVRTPGRYEEDHGIYAWGMRDIAILGNHIQGWSLSGSGGAIKVRNGEKVLIRGNTLWNSGILLYAYSYPEAAGSLAQYLRDVVVENNSINLRGTEGSCAGTGLFANLRPGISYWSNHPGSSLPGIERNILIRQNLVEDGSIAILAPAAGPAFSVTSNRAAFVRLAPAGIRHSLNRSEDVDLKRRAASACR